MNVLLIATAAWGLWWPAQFSNLQGATPGQMRLELAGKPAAHHALVGYCCGLPPGASVTLLVGVTADNLHVNGGLLVPHPSLKLTATANSEGVAAWTVPLESTPPTFFAQCMVRAGGVTTLSNAVACVPGAAP